MIRPLFVTGLGGSIDIFFQFPIDFHFCMPFYTNLARRIVMVTIIKWAYLKRCNGLIGYNAMIHFYDKYITAP